MKKVIYIIPIFLLLCVSCTPKLIPSKRIVNTFYFDYSDYSKEGFLISPDNYVGEFESCGELLVTVIPAKQLTKTTPNSTLNSNLYEYAQNMPVLVNEQLTSKDLLKIIVDKAKERGGNALVNFKCIPTTNSYYDPVLKRFITDFSHYELSGFVIKRK